MNEGNEQKKAQIRILDGASIIRGRRRGPAMRVRGPSIRTRVELALAEDVRAQFATVVDANGNAPSRAFYKIRNGEAAPPTGTLFRRFVEMCRRRSDKAAAKRIVAAIDRGVDRIWDEMGDMRVSGEWPKVA